MNATYDPKHFKRLDYRIACAYWLDELLQSPARLKELLDESEQIIRGNVGDDFHFFAVSGVSGIVLGTLLSQRFNRHLVVVRKRKESRHSGYIVEGLQSIHGVRTLKYVIVDDFISTGSTVKRMRYEVGRHIRGSELVGAYFFNEKNVKLPKELPSFSPEELNAYEKSRTEG